MNIVFVETPSPWLVRQHAQVSLGPLYLGTIIKNAGHHVRFFRMVSYEDLTLICDYDVICFSGTTLEYQSVITCARKLRDICSASIWYGGPHVTCMRSEVVSLGLFDAVSVGESEGHILTMIKDLQEGKLKDVYGPTAMSIDVIPFPDRSLVEGSRGGDIFAYGRNYIGNGNENVITSRGCVWDCAFCSSHVIFPKVKWRSVGNVMSEIEYVIESTGCRQIRFADDEIVAKRRRLIKICHGLQGMGCVWRCSARGDMLNEDICRVMYEGGCREVSVGFESGDQRVLDCLGKKTTVSKMEEGCLSAIKSGLNVRGLFMIGTPGERNNTPEINKELMEKIPFDSITLSTYVPLPGSPVWESPFLYGCEVIDADFSKYNKDFWVSKNGKKVKRETFVTIRSDFIDYEQQVTNINRMKKYVLEDGRCNRG